MSDFFKNTEELNSRMLTLPQAEVQKAKRDISFNGIKHSLEITLSPTRREQATNTALAVLSNTPVNMLSTQNKNQTILKALQQAPKQFLDNPEYMLSAIKKNHNAFEYASKRLKQDTDFVVKAIRANPAVYSHLSLEKKLDPTFHERYMKKIVEDATLQTVGGQLKRIPKQALDRDCPIDVKKDGQTYEQCLKDLRDPEKSIKEIIGSEVALRITLANMQAQNNPELAKEIDIERKSLAQREKEVKDSLELSKIADRRDPKANIYLSEMERQNPELTSQFEKNQKKLWQSNHKQAELYRAYQRVNAPKQRISRDDYEMSLDKKAEETIEEAKKRLKDIAVEDSLAQYLKGAYQDYIYSLQAAGRISQDDANLYVGMISSISSPSLLHATGNDFDNGDFHMTPAEIERAAKEMNTTVQRVESNLDTLYVIMSDAQTATKDSVEQGYNKDERKQEIDRYMEDPVMVRDEHRRRREEALAEMKKRQKVIHNKGDFITRTQEPQVHARKYV